MTFKQTKVFCCEAILRNIGQFAETHEVSDSFFKKIDKIMKDSDAFETNHPPTQCLVNEYIGNQGIKSHFDDSNAFGPIIASISLVSPIYFTLKYPSEPTNESQSMLSTTAGA